MTELPERPWQNISLDFSGPYPSGEYLLIVVDDYSRYPVAELVRTTSAAAVILRLDKHFSMFGIPEECKSDNGPPFQSREFAEHAKTQGFRHRKIAPLRPDRKICEDPAEVHHNHNSGRQQLENVVD